MNELREWFRNLLAEWGVSPDLIPVITGAGLLIAVFLLIFISLRLTRFLLKKIVYAFVIKTPGKWDDYLIRHKFFIAVSALVTVAILKNAVPVIFEDTRLLPFFVKLVEVYFIYVIIRIIVSLLRGTEAYLTQSPVFVEKPIASWFQLARIILYIAGGILAMSILMGRSPLYFLGAFGAMTAVLLLVFKDTILGLVASIQIASNDMIRVGDWVEMPKYNADGDVIAINLNTVKVRNWDKTISTVPTHYFITDSFKNWRGMQESGGRRIKRAISMNLSTIKFVDPDMRERFKKIGLIEKFITQRQAEIEAFNKIGNFDGSVLINGRRMTNIGVFRNYVESYLRHHPGIKKDMTLMVRQLSATETGLPLEIYCFTNTTDWTDYEGIQSDIFDHIYASASYFELEAFQSPAGIDIRSLKEKL